MQTFCLKADGLYFKLSLELKARKYNPIMRTCNFESCYPVNTRKPIGIVRYIFPTRLLYI